MGKKFYMTKEQTEEEKKLAAQSREKEMEKVITATSDNQRKEYNSILEYNSSLYDSKELNSLEFSGPNIVVAPFKIETINAGGFYIGTKENAYDPDTHKNTPQDNKVPYQSRGVITAISPDVDLETFNKNRKVPLKVGSVIHIDYMHLREENFFFPEKRYKMSHNVENSNIYIILNINTVKCIEKEQPYKEIETI